MQARKTKVAVEGQKFKINGEYTYKGRVWNGIDIEGLLFNTRMVQGIFDDKNPETISKWAYPDTGRWDPERNTREFIKAMPSWREKGVLAFNINLQGGSPEGYSKEQPWHNSAFLEDGTLDENYMARLEKILDRADELGMVAILGYFYQAQDQRIKDELRVRRAVFEATYWILERQYQNVLIEINNECNHRFTHKILKTDRVHKMFRLVREISDHELLVSASFGGGRVPSDNVIAEADYLLLHGNGVDDPDRIEEMVKETRANPHYQDQPIVFNEDDHFDFDQEKYNMLMAIKNGASWGFFAPGKNNYRDGYQSVPVNWEINTPTKKAFFNKVDETVNG